jgi:hypothetical protein
MIASKKRHVRELLWVTYNSLDEKLGRAAQEPDEFELQLDTVLQNHPDHGQDLVMLDYYSALVMAMEKSPRFRQALLCGLVAAKDVGMAKRQDLSNFVKKYDEMDDAQFMRNLSQATQDTSVCTRQPDVEDTN